MGASWRQYKWHCPPPKEYDSMETQGKTLKHSEYPA